MYEKIATCFFISDRKAKLVFLGGEYKNIEGNKIVENYSKDYNTEPEVKNDGIKPIYYM